MNKKTIFIGLPLLSVLLSQALGCGLENDREAPCGKWYCGLNAVCNESGSPPQCQCRPGFEDRGGACVEINGCADKPCFEGVLCVDKRAPATGYVCGDCPRGYEGDGKTCADVDGCAGRPCFEGVDCYDRKAPQTGFECGRCPAGYEGDGETCTDMDGCAGNPCLSRELCHDVPAPGTGFVCDDCPDGSVGNGVSCVNIDECNNDATHECHEHADCKDAPPPDKYFCTCREGYEGDGFTCVNFDACKDHPCFEGVECTDLPPPSTQFTCGACPAGYEGNGITCVDFDACAQGPCLAGVTCQDLPPPSTGYVCGDCPVGYHKVDGKCVDVDGCADNPCFDGVICYDNKAPELGYECGICPAGFEGDGETCADIDECLLPTMRDYCPLPATCINIENGGGFECSYPEGWDRTCKEGYTGDFCHIPVGCEETITMSSGLLSRVEALIGVCEEYDFNTLVNITALDASGLGLANLYPMYCMVELEDLDLSHNEFSGSIAMEWEYLPKLVKLDLSHNRIQTLEANGRPMFAALPALEVLDLTHNELDNLAETAWYMLPDLRALAMDSELLQKVTPYEANLTGLHRLEILRLTSQNSIDTSSWRAKEPLPTVRRLEIAANTIDNLLHSTVSDRLDPQEIVLSAGEVDTAGAHPSLNLSSGEHSWADFERLEVLEITSLAIEGWDTKTWSGLGGLEELRLRDNQLTHLGAVNWDEATALEHLAVTDNQLTDSLFASVPWKQLVHLKSVDLSGNLIEDLSAVDWSQWIHCEMLNLSRNNIDDVTALIDNPEFDELDQLTIDFSGNPIGCDQIEALLGQSPVGIICRP